MKIHHIGYLVKNIEKAAKEFISLGYAVEKDVMYDSYRDADIMFLINDELRVELVRPVSEKSVVYDLLKKYKNMPYHICYECRDIETSQQTLRNAGFLPIEEAKCAPAIEGRNVVFMMSAFSGMIELVEEA